MANDTRLVNEQAAFVEWLKLGTAEARKAQGLPETILEYSDVFKIGRATLHRWKNDPDVKRAVVDHGVTLFTVDEIRAARDKLVQRAVEEGNVQAIKMMLDLAGVTAKPNGEAASPKVSIEEVVGMSDAELDAELKRLEE